MLIMRKSASFLGPSLLSIIVPVPPQVYHVSKGCIFVCVCSFPPFDVPDANSATETFFKIWSDVNRTISRFVQGYKRMAQKHLFKKVDGKVQLSLRNLSLSVPAKKLCSKFIGPYEISAIVNHVTCVLKLTPSLRIPKVFHVSNLFIPVFK